MKWFNRIIVGILPVFPKSFIWIFSKRYIAGVDLNNALEKVKLLNAEKILATVDVLGEDISTLKEAAEARQQVIQTIHELSKVKLKAGISIKLTQLGLCIDTEACYYHVETIVQTAQKLGIFVRIDMEDSTTTDRTLEIYRRISKKTTQVGIVVQACLKRTPDDVLALIEEGICNIRVCKGIYDESPKIAYKNPDEIRAQFIKLTEMCVKDGSFTAIATHDKWLIDPCIGLIRDLNISLSRVEFQMLLGVTEHLRSSIVSSGYPMRVYVPYGAQWYGYCMRRMKENPQVAGHVIKNLFIRN
jgi:proline dehydrogenase